MRDLEQLGDAAAVVRRAGEPRIEVRAAHDRLRHFARNATDHVHTRARRRRRVDRDLSRDGRSVRERGLDHRGIVRADRDRRDRIRGLPVEPHRADLAQVLRRDREIQHRDRAFRGDVAQLRRPVIADVALHHRDLAGEIEAAEIVLGRVARVDDRGVRAARARRFEHVEPRRHRLAVDRHREALGIQHPARKPERLHVHVVQAERVEAVLDVARRHRSRRRPGLLLPHRREVLKRRVERRRVGRGQNDRLVVTGRDPEHEPQRA